MSLRDLQTAVLPHVVLQLLPGVWQHLQPLLGYIMSDDAADGGPRGPRVGLVYVEHGVRLPEHVKQTKAQQDGTDAPPPWMLVVRLNHRRCACSAAGWTRAGLDGTRMKNAFLMRVEWSPVARRLLRKSRG